MGEYIRTEIGIPAQNRCPVADASAGGDTEIDRVVRATARTPSDTIAEEFTADASAPIDIPEVEAVFTYETETVYRFERDQDHPCICERIEGFGYPISEIHARAGSLYVTLHLPDIETVQRIVDDLKAHVGEVQVRQLTRGGGRTGEDLVFIDRSHLTRRQREVLETSYAMGYFAHPKGANAGEVAAALGIAPSTFAEHLAAAQRKILESLISA